MFSSHELVDVAHVTTQSRFGRVRAFMASHSQGFASLQEVAKAIDVYQGKSTAHPPRKVDGLAKNLRLGADGRLYGHWNPRFLDGRDDLAAREKRLTQCVRQLTVLTFLVRGARAPMWFQPSRFTNSSQCVRMPAMWMWLTQATC